MIYGRDYGITDVQWVPEEVGSRLRYHLQRAPILNRLFHMRKVRIDFVALTKEGRPIMGTFFHTRIPYNISFIRFAAALGKQILCHGAAKVMYYLTDEHDNRLSEATYIIDQAGISRWHLYVLKLKKGE